MESIEETPSSSLNASRRSLLKAFGLAAAVTATSAALAGCGGSSSSASANSTDLSIISTAVIIEGLAATMYSNIISTPALFSQITDVTYQNFFQAAWEQETAHYNYLVAIGGTALASTAQFYYPTSTFQTWQQALNTLQVIEDLLIATYLTGVGSLSTDGNKLIFAQLGGVECEHRVLGRVVANHLGLSTVYNLANGPEMLGTDPANNYDYERTFAATTLPSGITSISTQLTTYYQATTLPSGYGPAPYTLSLAVSSMAPVVPDVPLTVGVALNE